MGDAALILTADEDPQYADGQAMLRLAERTGTLGSALAFVRAHRSLADFRAWLVADRDFNRALRPKRWCSAY